MTPDLSTSKELASPSLSKISSKCIQAKVLWVSFRNPRSPMLRATKRCKAVSKWARAIVRLIKSQGHRRARLAVQSSKIALKRSFRKITMTLLTLFRWVRYSKSNIENCKLKPRITAQIINNQCKMILASDNTWPIARVRQSPSLGH